MKPDGPTMLTELLREMGFEPSPGRPERPRVAASACLLGQPVRYDGGHKYHAGVANTLAARVTLVPLCPETAIGLPVPRPPIQVVLVGEAQRVRGLATPNDDFSDALAEYADSLAPALDGMVLKSRSPSCGFGTTPLHNESGAEVGVTSGAFAARLHARLPALPLCNDSDLDGEGALASFLLQVHCHHHWRQGRSLADLRQRTQHLARDLRQPLQRYLQRFS